VGDHFAVKYLTNELEPVPDTEDRLKIRAYNRPQPLDTVAECNTSDVWPTSQAITPDLHPAAGLACSAGAPSLAIQVKRVTVDHRQLQAKVSDTCFSQIEMLLVLWSSRRILVPAVRAI
jgi:hypothetical protein